jgi:hypothetical protein
MSDSNNDTSAIDKKREKDKSKSSINFISDIRNFITFVIGAIIIILLYFSSSGVVLFICKLAQSNILPTEPECYPYTSNQPNIEKIKTNIFTDKEMSMKLEIPIDGKNSKYGIIEMFKKYKERSNSNFLANYLISIIENLMQFNYSIINNSMSFLNTLPESVIIGIWPPVILFVYMFSLLLNLVYFIYLWFANMYWFFKTNTNVSGEGKPQWQDVILFSANPLNWIRWWIGFWLVMFSLFGFALLIFIPFITSFYCIISCLFYRGTLNGKTVSPFSLIKEIIKHYKITIVGLISFFVILSAFSNLGVVGGIFSIITILLIYFGKIGINIFKPIPEINLSPIVSNDQAEKTCSFESSKPLATGFFPAPLGFLNKLFGQKGGTIKKRV